MSEQKAGNQSSKGNPAHKRMMNQSLQKRRQKSYNTGKKRKEARVLANMLLHDEKKKNGGLGRRERRRIEALLRTPSGGLGAPTVVAE